MIKEYPVFKAAAVQAAPVFKDKPVYFDSKATLEKAVSLIAEAGRNGAKLIVLPETFLPGYPYWSLNMLLPLAMVCYRTNSSPRISHEVCYASNMLSEFCVG